MAASEQTDLQREVIALTSQLANERAERERLASRHGDFVRTVQSSMAETIREAKHEAWCEAAEPFGASPSESPYREQLLADEWSGS